MAPVRATVRIFLAPVAQARTVMRRITINVCSVFQINIRTNRARRLANPARRVAGTVGGSVAEGLTRATVKATQKPQLADPLQRPSANVERACIVLGRIRRLAAGCVLEANFKTNQARPSARHVLREGTKWKRASHHAINAGAAAQIAGELAAKGLVGATVKASHAPAGQARIAMERQEMFVSRVNRVNFRTKQARRIASRAPINSAVKTAGG